jgi:hypothetical protein
MKTRYSEATRQQAPLKSVTWPEVDPYKGIYGIKISGKDISVFLFSIVGVLLVLHLAVKFLIYNGYGSNTFIRLDQYFDLNKEKNFPTFFSSSLLMFSSLLSILIYKLHTPRARHRTKWMLLGFIFLFLALDEAIELHERLIDVTRRILSNDLSGYLHWAWIVPYTILTIVIGIYFLKFVLQLHKKIRNKLFLSGCIYFFAAVIIEGLEGHFINRFEPTHIIFDVTTVTQEILEMAGIIIFIRCLVEYIEINFKQITCTINK